VIVKIKSSILNAKKVSFDFNDILTTTKGVTLLKRLKTMGDTVYIISAQYNQKFLEGKGLELGIPASRIFATGSNKAKIEKVKELGIQTHYDNNSDVINQLPGVGQLFQ
jgi:soluble P-type ATPase